MMDLKIDDIKKAIIKSQHCQRNWDLSKDIPDEDLELFIHAATNCPSKQNVAYYDVYFITDRFIIEQIHNATNGFTYAVDLTTTNTQTLANLLVVFTAKKIKKEDKFRNVEVEYLKKYNTTLENIPELVKDKHMAIGIAAGYVNVIASMLGYSTGCCACFDSDKIREIINAEGKIELLMGVGYSNKNKNRRVHHLDDNFIFPTKEKQKISVFRL
jgi:nitroreductase